MEAEQRELRREKRRNRAKNKQSYHNKKNNRTNNNNNNARKTTNEYFDFAAAHYATPTVVPRFDIEDDAGYEYLEENGYVVFKDVANPQEIQQGISLAWDYLEGLVPGLDRNDVDTYFSPQWPDPFKKGIIAADSVGQCAFLWFCRGNPNVQRIYSKIWGTENLITSYDGFCMHRPIEYSEEWRTGVGWYHVDQNGLNKPNKACVQGFLNFYDSMEEDGGLVVVPQSPKIFKSIFKSRPHFKNRRDYITLSKDRALWRDELPAAGLRPIKVCAKAGDFVLWDSRTIHCNAPATSLREIPDGAILPPRRLVAYVCMTPADNLDSSVITRRINAYLTGQTTSHWPEDCLVEKNRRQTIDGYVPLDLAPEQKKLIPME
eukprot:CAMPEP_0174251554 /NCGR_PEP_ID=MMETSP0439-20130205/1338_1 /TAXON_ID=0 /ORGANISM="Stereomyxa ramosa, Strain Chinc5" /LENGTH=374 /DNA_ID=CAMNT_0015331895 /DNA_START=40 /DNA_END=1164 /DNA_ORIENTATION=+